MNPKTDAELKAAFAAVFKDVKPEVIVTQEMRLEPYRKHIMKLRKRGVSWKAIAQGMADPRLGEKVSSKLLSRVFEPKKSTAPSPAAPPAAPPVEALFIDPATGKMYTRRIR